MHESLLIALLQAREVVLGYFRPTLKAHRLTEQQWRIIRILAKTPSLDFHLPGSEKLYSASQPDRHSDTDGKSGHYSSSQAPQ